MPRPAIPGRAGEINAYPKMAGYRWRNRLSCDEPVLYGRCTPPEAGHVAQARPDPACARGDSERRASCLPQGQPSPQPARRARRHLRRCRLRRLVPRAGAARCCHRGGWRWSPSCNSARGSPTGGPPRPSGHASTGSTPSASSWPTPALTTRSYASSAPACWRAAPRTAAARAARGLPSARPAQGAGRQRTDSTHVVAAVRASQPPRAGRRDLARGLNSWLVAPAWLRAAAPEAWYKRYGHRIEDVRLPGPRPNARPTRARSAKTASRCSTGRPAGTPEDLAGAEGRGAAAGLGAPLRRGPAAPGGGTVRLRARTSRRRRRRRGRSPYDPEARFRTRADVLDRLHRPPHRDLRGRRGPSSHPRDDDGATVHEARCTAPIHSALAAKGLAGRAPGGRGLCRRRAPGAQPRGTRHRYDRPGAAEPVLADSGQGRVHDRAVRGRLGEQQVRCPQGKLSSAWSPGVDKDGRPYVR